MLHITLFFLFKCLYFTIVVVIMHFNHSNMHQMLFLFLLFLKWFCQEFNIIIAMFDFYDFIIAVGKWRNQLKKNSIVSQNDFVDRRSEISIIFQFLVTTFIDSCWWPLQTWNLFVGFDILKKIKFWQFRYYFFWTYVQVISRNKTILPWPFLLLN